MLFRRKKRPDESKEPEEVEKGYNMMEEFHARHREWASEYIQSLEMQLYELLRGCQECPFRNLEDSACNDQIPD